MLSDLEVEPGPDLGSGKTTGSGICRDSLLVRAQGEVERDLGRNLQPRGSRPVITEVCMVGGEEQEEEVEEEEDDDEDRLGELKIPTGGQE